MNPMARYPHYILFALAAAFVVTGLTGEALVVAAGGIAIAASKIWKRRKRGKDDRDR